MKDIMTNLLTLIVILSIPFFGTLIGFWWCRKDSPSDNEKEEARYELKRIAVIIALICSSILMYFFFRDKVFN